MRIAVEGCAHGELEKIYDTIQGIEKFQKIKIDLLLCCGDFQSTRNLDDLQTMAVPKKYQDICTFYKYYSGELKAPILTIFIGGNHEASNYLQELPYGGWVAPNIYYLGYAGVVQVNGIRIGGLSGIYKSHDYFRGRHEFPPYSDATVRSVYHIRQLEVFRMKQLSGPIDIVMSHDWPRGIYNSGNQAQLLRFKPHFRDDIDNGRLGSPPCEDLLLQLKPKYWFAAHLHCKFSAVVRHDGDNETGEEHVTRFLALDKCQSRRRFLQILKISSADDTDEGNLRFEYDLEWLTILHLTNNLLSVKNSNYYMPGKSSSFDAANERSDFTPTIEEKEHVRRKFLNDLKIPENFCRNVEPYDPKSANNVPYREQPKPLMNPQSVEFCDKLGIDDPLALAMLICGHDLSYSSNLESSVNTTPNDSCLSGALAHSMDSSAGCQALDQSPVKRSAGLGLSLPKPLATGETSDTDENKSSPTAVSPSAQNTSNLRNPDELVLNESDDDMEKNDGVVAEPKKDAIGEPESKALVDAVETTHDASTDDAIRTQPSQMPSQPEVKSPAKKFIRRNMNIYAEPEDNAAGNQ